MKLKQRISKNIEDLRDPEKKRSYENRILTKERLERGSRRMLEKDPGTGPGDKIAASMFNKFREGSGRKIALEAIAGVSKTMGGYTSQVTPGKFEQINNLNKKGPRVAKR